MIGFQIRCAIVESTLFHMANSNLDNPTEKPTLLSHVHVLTHPTVQLTAIVL